MFLYIAARYNQYGDLRNHIWLHHAVKSVSFDSQTSKFQVAVRDMENDVILPEEEFDFVINCARHFSVPNRPDFEGQISSFIQITKL